MRKRTQSRELALKILYQSDVARKKISQSAVDFKEMEDSPNDDIWKFTQSLISGVEEHLKAIDAKITQYATNWQIDRMAVIDRNILRLGFFELNYLSDVPPKVTINEAVELAKKYGDIESGKFVNGILDKFHKAEIVPQNKKS